MSIYQSKTTVQSWYGSSVTIPSISSPKFIPFASSCMGIAISLLDKKTNKKISVGLSDKIDTAYAAPDENLIVISKKFLSGDFSAIGATDELNAPKTVGAVLGVIVHEIGHFAYSPKTLLPYIDHVQSQTKKPFNFDLARTIANTLEDIFIEYQIAHLAPTLEWTLDEINKLMLTDAKYSQTIKQMKTVNAPDGNVGAILNFLLFAKVVTEARKTSSFTSKLFVMARSVCKMSSLSERAALCLALYNLIAPDAPTVKNAPLVKKQQTPEPTEDEDDSEPEPENDPEDDATEPTEDEELTPNSAPEPTEDAPEDEDDSEDDSEPTESHTDDLEDEDETEDDPEDEDEYSASVGSEDDETEPEPEDETEDDDPEDENDNSGSGSEDDSEDENDSDSEDEDDSENDPSGESEDDSEDETTDNDPEDAGELGNDYDAIPQIDTFQTRDTAPIPAHTTIQTDLGYKPSLDGHIVIETTIKPDAAKTLEMDKRYTKLSEMTRQRTNANVGYGEQKTRGRNLRQIHRIITDQKVFSSKVLQTTVKPIDAILILDCSGSMGTYSPEQYDLDPSLREDKLMSASRAILGASVGLLEGKSLVQVYGHTSDPYMQYKQLLIYRLLLNGENTTTLARRLYTLNHPNSYLGERFMYYNRDGYALYEIAKKFQSKDRQKVMIVISDGAPNGDGRGYEGMQAIDHTRQMVKNIRASGIKVYSISIDRSAYQANNYIYGSDYNTNATDANAIDQLIRQIYK